MDMPRMTDALNRALCRAGVHFVVAMLCISQAASAMPVAMPHGPENETRLDQTIAWLKEWDITASQGMSRATDARRSAAMQFSRQGWLDRAPGSKEELHGSLVRLLTWNRHLDDCTPQAILAMQHFGTPSDARLIVGFFDSESYWNKICAAETILVVWDEEAMRATMHLAEYDGNDNVRSQACHTLIQLCKPPPGMNTAEAKPYLSDQHRREVLDLLQRMSLNDKSNALRSFLVESLKQVDSR